MKFYYIIITHFIIEIILFLRCFRGKISGKSDNNCVFSYKYVIKLNFPLFSQDNWVIFLQKNSLFYNKICLDLFIALLIFDIIYDY